MFSQNAHGAVLTAAFDIIYLPFKRPLFHIFDYIDDLQTAQSQGVIAADGKCCAIDSILN